jgi:translation initiation factor IF-3
MIRVPQVRLIGAEGEQMGVLSIQDALGAADKVGLDLVEVAPTAKPPVCRLMDYGKYKYQMSKKAHEAKKKQAVIHLKEIKLRCNTEEHDIQFKVRNIKKFLEGGDKVKVTMVFRGREITHPELGVEKLNRIVAEVKDVGVVEQTPKFEGRSLHMMLGPSATVKQ